jgi:hypothetical protein
LGSFLKITERPNILDNYLLNYILIKNGLDRILGNFIINSSGHPAWIDGRDNENDQMTDSYTHSYLPTRDVCTLVTRLKLEFTKKNEFDKNGMFSSHVCVTCLHHMCGSIGEKMLFTLFDLMLE